MSLPHPYATRLRGAQNQLAKEVPGCKWLGSGYWLVPPDCREILGLSAYAYEAVPLDLSRLGPISDLLHQSQRDDLAFIFDTGGALIAHPTSGGKSLTGLCTAALKLPDGPTLICGPALGRHTWAREAAKWFDYVPFYVCRGQTPNYDFQSAEWVYLSYEIAYHWQHTLRENLWAAQILDEIHELRGRNTQRSRGIKGCYTFQHPLTVGLSATPVWSKIPDLWNALDMVRPGWFGGSFKFSQRYAGATIGDYGGVVIGEATNSAELQTRLKHTICRRPKAEILPDLPPLRRHLRRVHSDEAAARLQATARAAKTLAKDEVEFSRILASAARRETALKTDCVPDWIKSGAAKRVVLSYQLHESVDYAVKVLRAAGYKVLTFTGKQTVKRRMAIVDLARNMDEVVLVVSAESIRQSVDCTGFDTVYVLEYPWTAEALLQYEGRVHRHGVDVPIDVWYVVINNSYDAGQVDMLTTKLANRARAVGIDDADAQLGQALRAPVKETLNEMLRRMGLD